MEGKNDGLHMMDIYFTQLMKCVSISVRIKASGNSCKIPMAVSTSYPRLPSPLSWCGEAFATRNIFTDGKFRAFERF